MSLFRRKKKEKDENTFNITTIMTRNLLWYARSKSWMVSSSGDIVQASCNPKTFALAVTYPRSQTMSIDEIENCFQTHLKNNENSAAFCALVGQSISKVAPELISDIVFMIISFCYDVVNLSKQTSTNPLENGHIFLPLRSLVESVAVSSDIQGGGTGVPNASVFIAIFLMSKFRLQPHCFLLLFGHILFDFEFPVRISSYMLKAANDCKERDPRAWRVFGLPKSEYQKFWENSNEVNAVLLDSRGKHEFVERWQSFRFEVTHPDPPLVKSVLIAIDEYWGQHSFSGIQLGQIAFYGYV
ncbi:hypothetical protein RFI_05415 [Reticulomyxa filosa]|uniref:Uncharacterized protein n=1 Tax=Reticulomyxa filosa TaxID=46433 RepID=X6P2B8_RETFI|nr:hypothetical protein RFI_05415 [Reticulomyxa filosa]|eukprot:ETO31702.1 hypothetical protein RFI_05415 [Reticulomyxa filosa]